MLLYLLGNQLRAFVKNIAQQENDSGSTLLSDWIAWVEQLILKKWRLVLNLKKMPGFHLLDCKALSEALEWRSWIGKHSKKPLSLWHRKGRSRQKPKEMDIAATGIP